MAVFTAIATAIVGAIGLTGIAATIATSIIAGGLAFGTAKVLGVFKPPQMGSQKDPGVKIQLPPQTDNKLPVFYGRNVTGAIIVDAGIKNQNNTMVYAMCIGEKTDTGTYTINKIYRDDTELVFSGATVTSAIDPNATASNKVNGKMRCRVYAGGTASTDQIFPTTGKVAATTLLPTIDGTTNYANLVYAVFEMDYDPENGLTGLGAINYDITNSLSEPSNVLLDYLQNDRYGAGLSNTDLDLTSFDDLYDYSTASVAYTTDQGVGDVHARWRVDGMLSTYVPVKQNIDTLCQTCSTFFTYNPKEGKFAVVPNRAATTAEKNAAYQFTDDNLIGPISITSTDLYGLYNKIEVEYPSLIKKDQTDTVFVTTPAGDRNPNEPENKLTTRYPLVNDNTRVENLANIDLRQSRTSLVVEVEADYEAITVDAGDVVKLTNTEYGFSNKLFRCMRTTEQETTDGMLAAKLVLLEYSDDVYTHSNVQSRGQPGVSGIPGWWTGVWGNIDLGNIGNVVTGNVTIVDDPTSGNANIIDPNTGNVVGNVGLGNTNVVYPPGLPGGGPIINFPITIPNIPDIETICINLANMNVAGIDQPGHFCYEHLPANGDATYEPGSNVTVPVPIPAPQVPDPTNPNLPIAESYEIDFDIHFNGPAGMRTSRVNIPSVPISYIGGISRNTQGPIQAGLQEEDDFSNLNMVNAAVVSAPLGSANSQLGPTEFIDLGGVDYGEFTAVNSAIPYGGTIATDTYHVAYNTSREVRYKEFDIDPVTGKYTANANVDIFETFAGQGVTESFPGTNIPTTYIVQFNYEISTDRANTIATSIGRPAISSTKTYLANVMGVTHFANNDMGASGGTVRGFTVANQDKRITKSDDYLPILPAGSIGP